MLQRPVLPICQFDRPERAIDRLSERRCVLDDNACDAIGIFEHQVVSDGAAEIHYVHAGTCDPELVDQRLRHLRKMGVKTIVQRSGH
jgi:hypothetical protein